MRMNLLNSQGKVVGQVPIHYRQPTKSDVDRIHAMSKGVPVAVGLGGGKSEQFEYVSGKQGKTMRSIGQMYIGTVVPTAETNNPGQRLLVQPILPAALGGPMALLSQEFEQHRVHKMRFIYKPSVPATSAGAICMYFRNDITTPLLDVGVDELKHAATHPSFSQSQVWEELVINVSPDDAINKFFSETTGDFQLSMQGVFQVLSAADLSSLAGVSLGNIYMEYDVEFFGEELDYNEGVTYSGQIRLIGTNVSFSESIPASFPFSTAVGVGAPPIKWNFLAGTVPPNSDYILVLVLKTITNTISIPPQFILATEANGRDFAPGMAFYLVITNEGVGFVDFSSGGCLGALASNPVAANEVLDNFDLDVASGTADIALLGTESGYTGYLDFDYYAIPLDQ